MGKALCVSSTYSYSLEDSNEMQAIPCFLLTHFFLTVMLNNLKFLYKNFNTALLSTWSYSHVNSRPTGDDRFIWPCGTILPVGRRCQRWQRHHEGDIQSCLLTRNPGLSPAQSTPPQDVLLMSSENMYYIVVNMYTSCNQVMLSHI